ncbi:hypothetical protein HQ585_08565 [candidate division KSB1 bacterium]|nr:hypothetical protein [candidate division KSB1 bacterium]
MFEAPYEVEAEMIDEEIYWFDLFIHAGVALSIECEEIEDHSSSYDYQKREMSKREETSSNDTDDTRSSQSGHRRTFTRH